MTSILFSKFACESGLVDPGCTTTRRAAEGAVVTASGPLASALLTTEVLLSTDESKPTKHQVAAHETTNVLSHGASL